MKKWSEKYDLNACMMCNSNKLPHCWEGFCRGCADKVKWLCHAKRKEQINRNNKLWRKKHKEKFNEICNRAVKKFWQKNKNLSSLYNCFTRHKKSILC